MAAKDFLHTSLINNFRFDPTSCQEKLFSALASFITHGSDVEVLIINGYAGTGKTTAISALVATLKSLSITCKLMAPTGRAAKVLSSYAGEKATTIHKHIYRQKSLGNDGIGLFSLDFNKSNDTIYIVDEASLINVDSESSFFGSGNLVADLLEFIRNGRNNKLILMGDKAQLPPVNSESSPALDESYISGYAEVMCVELRSVVRQAQESGILMNATRVRHLIENYQSEIIPKFQLSGFDDIERINGGDLIEALGSNIDREGIEEIAVLCRSNKRANKYNNGIRSTVLFREEALNRGDRLMVVKNSYNFEADGKLDFIANGDVAELVRIGKYEERYGLNFAEAVLSFPDYDDVEVKAKIIMDTLSSETASLNREQQSALYEGVYADYSDYGTKKKILTKVKEDKYYNALQIKYSTAITCHKSQGGQWNVIFIDNALWNKSLNLSDIKWLYTALTRAVKKVYLVNYGDEYFE